MDVISVMRGITGIKRIGHAGTLDPLATGVLLVCIGKATKQIEQLMGMEKEYHTSFDLSATSETDDAQGPLHPAVINQIPTHCEIETVLQSFQGEINQIPPQYSAIKIGGTRAYKHARQGHTIELKARPVFIKNITILDYQWPLLQLDITCGKGVYVRSLARDLGQVLHTGGYVSALQRTRIGPYTIQQAHSLEQLQKNRDGINTLLLPPINQV